MKTTIEISDPLLRRAKRLAVRRGTSLRVIIEEALQRELDVGESAPGVALRTHTFGGRGLQSGVDWSDWSTIRAMSYEGRGG